MSKYRLPLVLFLIVSTGTFLRLLNLGKECLWLDEAISYYRGLMSLPSIIQASYGWDFHPPTYYFIMHFVTQFGRSEATLRLFSVICGVLAIPVFYKLSQHMMGKREAVISAFLLSISVYHIRYSQEARVYSLFFLASVFSLLFFYRAFITQRRRDWFLWAGISLVNFYIHYFSLVLLLSQVFFYIFHVIRKKTYRHPFRDQRWFLLGLLIIFIGCAPQILFFIQQASSRIDTKTVFWRPANPIHFVLIFLKNVVSPVKLLNPLLERGLKYLVGGLIFLGILAGWRRYREAILFNCALIFFALLFAWTSSFLLYFSGTFRHVIFLAAPFLLLMTLSVAAVADVIVRCYDKIYERFVRVERSPLRGWRNILTGLVLFVFCIPSFYVLPFYYKGPRKADWRAGLSHLVEHFRESDVIVPIPGWADYVVRYYISDYGIAPRIIKMNKLSSTQMDSLITEHRGVFFITDGHLSASPLRDEMDKWLDQKTTLIWRDSHFSRSAVWKK